MSLEIEQWIKRQSVHSLLRACTEFPHLAKQVNQLSRDNPELLPSESLPESEVLKQLWREYVKEITST